MATLPQAFDGRSDYVGFINRRDPAGGIFAGAEVPKTPAQVRVFGGVAGEQYDPCHRGACDTIDTVTGQPLVLRRIGTSCRRVRPRPRPRA